MNYAFRIHRDHYEGEDTEVIGPRDADDGLVAALREGSGRLFRLYDDDQELIYEGRYIDTGPDDELGEEAFGPLDDYGMPNFGCTEIRYREDNGRFVTL